MTAPCIHSTACCHLDGRRDTAIATLYCATMRSLFVIILLTQFILPAVASAQVETFTAPTTHGNAIPLRLGSSVSL